MAEEQTSIERERDSIQAWRRGFFDEVLRKHGVRLTSKALSQLERSGSSPHDLVRLIDSGCNPMLAVKILR